MPEGPSLVILKEEVQSFKGKKILEVSGNSKIDLDRLLHHKVIDFKTWGKHFLICFKGFYIRIHFLLFGTYRINETKESKPRLHLKFRSGELNFYAAAIRLEEGDPGENYDWTADVMSDEWDPKAARKKLGQHPDTYACDALLDQDIFSGVGNIIKNEVLFRLRIHPLSTVGALPPAKLRQLIEQARIYSFEFLEWKKKFELKKHWKAHRQKTCPRDDIPFKIGNLGKRKRKAYYCEKCMKKY